MHARHQLERQFNGPDCLLVYACRPFPGELLVDAPRMHVYYACNQEPISTIQILI